MSLEDKVKDKESKGFIRKAGRLAWKLGMAAATTALSVATVGTLGIAVGASFAAGGIIANLAKGKSLYDVLDRGLTTYSAVNAIIYPIVQLGNLTFPLIDNATMGGKLLRGLYGATAYNAAFVGSFRGAAHLVDNYLNPKGIGESLKKDFWRDTLFLGAVFSPFYYLAGNNITQLAMSHPWTGYKAAPTFAWGAAPTGFVYNYGWVKDAPSGKH